MREAGWTFHLLLLYEVVVLDHTEGGSGGGSGQSIALSSFASSA